MRIIAAVVLLLALCISGVAEDMRADYAREALANQGFTGALSGKVTISEVGAVTSNGKRYQIFYYRWEETNPAGKAVHLAQRLIIFDGNNRYLGSYAIEGHPSKLRGESVFFSYPGSAGNRIAFGKNGPPAQVLLAGEIRMLAK